MAAGAETFHGKLEAAAAVAHQGATAPAMVPSGEESERSVAPQAARAFVVEHPTHLLMTSSKSAVWGHIVRVLVMIRVVCFFENANRGGVTS